MNALAAFLRRLFRPGDTASAVPEGLRIYAIGDVHGRADLLGRMAGLIDTDLRAQPAARAEIVTLGDYVDRGPASAAVLDRLARGDLPAPLIPLRGNHDALLLAVLRGETGLGELVDMGGEATLASYGLDLAALRRLSRADRVRAMAAAVPAAHRSFLDGTAFSHERGGYFFCHAGVRPGLALEAQVPEDLIWIRGPFLRSQQDFGRIVVHGHTPVRWPEIRPNRINVDTQAFASGHLTAVVLEGTTRRFLQT